MALSHCFYPVPAVPEQLPQGRSRPLASVPQPPSCCVERQPGSECVLLGSQPCPAVLVPHMGAVSLDDCLAFGPRRSGPVGLSWPCLWRQTAWLECCPWAVYGLPGYWNSPLEGRTQALGPEFLLGRPCPGSDWVERAGLFPHRTVGDTGASVLDAQVFFLSERAFCATVSSVVNESLDAVWADLSVSLKGPVRGLSWAQGLLSLAPSFQSRGHCLGSAHLPLSRLHSPHSP